MRTAPHSRSALPEITLFFCLVWASVTAQNIPGLMESNSISFHESLCARYRAGDTNLPLLRLDSFEGPLKGGSVTKDGKLASGWYNGISNPSSWRTLNNTNLTLLKEALEALPASNTNVLALRRQVHISGARSNGYYHSVYDLNDCPKEVRRLFELFGWPFSNPKL